MAASAYFRENTLHQLAVAFQAEGFLRFPAGRCPQAFAQSRIAVGPE
jgi:hypothetical protein